MESLGEEKSSNVEENTANDGHNTSASNKFLATGIPGSVSVSLHPLVLLNISDHWTRMKTQHADSGETQVLGAIIGKQTGREVEIMNSFELQYEVIDGCFVVSTDYYRLKEEQYKQVFSEMSLLGWYTTSGDVSEKHILIHKQVNELVESPLLLKLDPLRGGGDLGVQVFESVVVGGGNTDIMLVRLDYTLATEEAERVGVDHVARVAAQSSGESSNVADNVGALSSAVRMLVWRIEEVAAYVRAVGAGELPVNHHLLRSISALTNRLPLIQSEAFTQQFYTQTNDVLLVSYLAALTKCCDTTNRYLNRFSVLYDKAPIGRKLKVKSFGFL